MSNFPGLEPIDYLLVGHITQDLTPEGAHKLKKTMPLDGFAIQIVVGDMGIEEAGALYREMTL